MHFLHSMLLTHKRSVRLACVSDLDASQTSYLADQPYLLEYDGSAFDLDEQELQRRRLTFWELYTWDVWNVSHS